jgi:hypothetical protein
MSPSRLFDSARCRRDGAALATLDDGAPLVEVDDDLLSLHGIGPEPRRASPSR